MPAAAYDVYVADLDERQQDQDSWVCDASKLDWIGHQVKQDFEMLGMFEWDLLR